MISRRISGLALRPIWVAALCAAAWHGTASAGGLTVCIDKSNPAATMDRKLAAAIGRVEHVPVVTHDFDGGSNDDDGFALKNFRTLAASTCQLVLGFPVDATSAALPPGMMATEPYGRIGFVLVTPRGSRAQDLAGLPNGTDVAVTYLTMPNLYFENHPNVEADVHTSDLVTLQTLVDRHVKAAMVWRPTYVSYLQSHPHMPQLTIHALNEPHATWNVVALYDANGADAAATFNAGIDQLRAANQLAPLLAPYADAAPVQLAAAAAPVSPPPASAPILAAAGPAIPALYTADQATAGEAKFAANCAVCHGKDLSGMAGPALKGKNFASAKADFSVSDVFAIVSQNMPATQPGSLAHDDYVQIMAFLLQQNGYPAGTHPLTYAGATASKTPLRYHGT